MARILVFSHEVIGVSMAGPGIRCWEMAVALAQHHEVTLAAPNAPDVEGDGFTVVSYGGKRLAALLRGVDMVITQLVSPAMALAARKHGVRVIVDAYDPILLETLEVFRHQNLQQQRAINRRRWAEMSLTFLVADTVICASEKQRDLWLGVLMALDRIRPEVYTQDTSLRGFIDVVSFGLREGDPIKRGSGIRERFGLRANDTVLLWAGGIYDWYDTPTLIRAMEIVSKRRQDIKLVFLGLKHPNVDVKESNLTAKTKNLSDKLGLTDKVVIFNFDWIAYRDWPNYLLEADIGLSTHFDHLETRFSFRTRVIDSYLWGLKPIITTKGDSMAELVVKERIGKTVDYEDAQGLAAAILELAEDKAQYAAMQDRMKTLRDEYRWSKVTAPLEGMAAALASQRPRRYGVKEVVLMVKLYYFIFRQVSGGKGVGYALKRGWSMMAGMSARQR